METRKKKCEPDIHHERLMEALKFNIKDLDANRDGWLTVGQQKRIRNSQFEDAIAVTVVTLVSVGLLFLAANAEHSVTSAQSWIMMVIILPVALSLFWYQHHTLQVLKRGKVITTHGPIKLEHVSDRGASRYAVSTLYKRFSITEEVYAAFVDGETYTLYYAPGLDTLISAEHHLSETRHPKTRHSQNMQKREPDAQPINISYWPSKKPSSPFLSQTPRKAAFKRPEEHITTYKSLPRHQAPRTLMSKPRMPRPRTKS